MTQPVPIPKQWEVKVFMPWSQEVYRFAGMEAEKRGRKRYNECLCGPWDAVYLYADDKLIQSWTDTYDRDFYDEQDNQEDYE